MPGEVSETHKPGSAPEEQSTPAKPPGRPAVGKRLVVRVLALFAGIVVAGLLLEIGLRIYEAAFLPEGLLPWNDEEEVTFMPGRHHAFVPVPGSTSEKLGHTVNSLSFRAPEFTPLEPGDVRILAIGDSTVFGFAVPQKEDWPSKLEAILSDELQTSRIEVFNLGVIGSTSWGSLLDLKKYGPVLEPQIVIASLGGWNDYQVNALAPELTDREIYELTEQNDDSISGLREEAARRIAGREEWSPFLGLATYRFYRRVRSNALVVRERAREQRLIDEGAYAADAIELPRRVPVAQFRENLHAMCDWAEEHGAQIWFCEQVLVRERMEAYPNQTRENYGIAATYREVVREVAKERGAGYIRTGEAIDRAAEGQPTIYFWFDWIHLTAHGYGIWARTVADAILPAVREELARERAAATSVSSAAPASSSP